MCDLDFTSLEIFIPPINKRLLNDVRDILLALGFHRKKTEGGRGEGTKEGLVF